MSTIQTRGAILSCRSTRVHLDGVPDLYIAAKLVLEAVDEKQRDLALSQLRHALGLATFGNKQGPTWATEDARADA